MCVILERPGLHPSRLLRLMEQSIHRCKLNLEGLTILTEAATGAYVITPVLAAMAGAREVHAITQDSRFGSASNVATQTYELAKKAGVDARICVIRHVTNDVIAKADIVTNSGHVRPIDEAKIAAMKPTAVIPLMYENWEFRSSDVDVGACRKYGILVAGTNEQHPDIGVFEFLGNMAIKLILDSGIALRGSHVLLLCDNAFESYLQAGLRAAGSEVITSFQNVNGTHQLDAVLVATIPAHSSALTAQEIRQIAEHSPGAPVIQFFGTLDRSLLRQHEIPVWPEREPEVGHMGILPSAIGPEPIVRLQTGGLKVGEVLYHRRFRDSDASLNFLQAFPM